MTLNTLQKLAAETRKFQRVELTRLGGEVTFISEIDTTVDNMIGSVVNGLLVKLEPTITQYTNLPEDKEFLKSLIANAVYKAVSPSAISGISDIINRRPGEIFGMVTGLSSVSNTIGGVSNRESARLPSNLETFSRGAFRVAQSASPEVLDITDQLYTKIFNIASLTLTTDPGLTPQGAMSSLGLFVSDVTSASDNLTRFNELSQTVSDNCASLDSTYYAIDHFGKTTIAQGFLDKADIKLVNVRSKLINLDQFDSYRYGLAQQDVESASDVLANSGNATNRVQEIIGAMAEMDNLLVLMEESYGGVLGHLDNLKDYMGGFQDEFSCNSSILGIMDNVQSEIRSIISSMDATIAKNQPSIMPGNERKWWLQLLSILKKMDLIPDSINDYYTTDPDGYIADYNTNISANLAPITPDTLDLLQGQMQQLHYWVTKRLGSDIVVTPLVNLVTQMISDNNGRIADITNASGIAAGYSVPISKDFLDLNSLFDGAGMDRAQDLFERGNWEDFFDLRSTTATYLGSLEESVRNTLTEIEDDSTITLDGIDALTRVHTFVRNQKRSRDVLASVFSMFKDQALAFKVNEEIPRVQEITGLVERFESEAQA